MNINKQILQTGFVLFFITIAVFFGLFFVFSTQGKISEAEYFNYSAYINCFFMPVLYAGAGLYSIFKGAKEKPLTFGQGFKLAFLPQFIGGFLGLAFIFIFFNTTGSWAEDSLQRGWYELMTANPNPDFMKKNGEMVKNMTDLNVNMFTLKVFFVSFSMLSFFYLLISSFFAMFLKNRKI
jgi:hypothetical protein